MNGLPQLLTQLREMVVALLDESDLCLSDAAVEEIVDNVINSVRSGYLGPLIYPCF